MSFIFNLSYCKRSVPNEVESRSGEKRADLSFQLGLVCDAQTVYLIGFVSMLAEAVFRYFVT